MTAAEGDCVSDTQRKCVCVCQWMNVCVLDALFFTRKQKFLHCTRSDLLFYSNNNNGLLIMTERRGDVALSDRVTDGSLELSRGQCADGQLAQNSEEAYSSIQAWSLAGTRRSYKTASTKVGILVDI